MIEEINHFEEEMIKKRSVAATVNAELTVDGAQMRLEAPQR